MKVCAALVPVGVKRPFLPTRGYGKRPAAADLSLIGSAAFVVPPTILSVAATPQGGEKCGLVAIPFNEA
jgi:hypothetical protein